MLLKPEYELAFSAWLDSPLGHKFSRIEAEVIASILPELFGYQAVIIGSSNFATGLQQGNFKITSLVQASSDANWNDIPIPAMCARYDKLGIDSEIIDCVYLAHCLEFSNNPSEVLREAQRILRPDGHLIITVFNPLSSWGCWRTLAKMASTGPWRANFMSLFKLKDWLALLGFDIMQVQHFGYSLPLHYGEVATKLTRFERLGQKLNFPIGAAYMIEASKRIIPITPIKPQWLAEREVVAAHDDAAEPTV